ncbi:N5-glutamine S-adenosyl-L-methionine-dependent methyltransferase [Williamsoniiplasma somnilux]|uniref:peptide chain release factor N(5)-glutamine methyltransferase n=1 Tax=Williamsoniiplasma somnilux TaxID=215578 RepID=A0A2K8NXH3_9MOLU|nr:peptide chain release factor N(5)-glutamine methyltransferase [Williamsoniiplasma somnilux]ATZ18487.1 N5-glutamine S-adenosyl-L-methionine-dependent methyltransferase [Williamsoniiplasma somnilux]
MILLDAFRILTNLNISLPKADVYHVLEKITKRDRQWLINNFDKPFNQKENLEMIIEELQSGKPLAYILKEKYFFGFKFYVDSRVLIPRPETELLVSEGLKFLEENPQAVVSDVCCGSGNIGISISKIKNISINLIDISREALEVAQINSLKTKVNIFQGDYIWALIEQNIKSDLILVNPPYINKNDLEVKESVFKYEPNLALYAENNGLIFYKHLFVNYKKLINNLSKFKIVMEFGWNQKEELELMAHKFLDLETTSFNFLKDYSNNWRCIIIENR